MQTIPSLKKVLFRGAPMVFLTATEHYGSVMNRPFRYDKYLADAASKGITYTRLFRLFRELQSAQNPYSTCKPESPDYIHQEYESTAEKTCSSTHQKLKEIL